MRSDLRQPLPLSISYRPKRMGAPRIKNKPHRVTSSLFAQQERQSHDYQSRQKNLQLPEHLRWPKNSLLTSHKTTQPFSKKYRKEARTHIFIHVVSQAKNRGSRIGGSVVQTAKRWREYRGIGRGEAAMCFYGGAFPQSFKKKGVRGLSPKA